jgi:ferrous iron transport protein B
MAEVSELGNEIWPQVSAHFGMLGGFSFLMFNLLCIPCFAAVGAIKREMNNAGWTWFAIIYQTVFAYAVSFVFYQTALWLTGGSFNIGTILGLVVLGLGIYLAVRQPVAKASQNLAESEA